MRRDERGYLDEAISLLKALDIDDVETVFVKKPNHRYYLQEELVKKMISNGERLKLIVVYDKLKPWQFYNLSKDLGCDVWDLVLLLLKIFEIHAGTKEAKLQIELSHSKHMIPVVKEYIRMTKLGEQVGFMGPGVYGYESLLRTLRMKEVRISRELAAIKTRRERLVFSRTRKGYPHVAIIGYTCAGKTTLYNMLTGDAKPTGPMPFKTLAPKSRAGDTPCGRVIFTDTIGFIRKMPSELIEVFHSVISEIKYADSLVFVVDALDPGEEMLEKIETALNLLEKIGAMNKPIVIAFNKIDLLGNYIKREEIERLVRGAMEARSLVPHRFTWISAAKGINIEELLTAICSTIGINNINAASRF
jgi:GTP-binding protein HflX